MSKKKIHFHKSFEKSFKRRILGNKKLKKRVEERVRLFKEDRNSPLLKDHRLIGIFSKRRSFSVTGDVRIIYREEDDLFIFLDIGTHAQVYDM